MLKCTLVTIATLLGTGILGLPSTLAYSGLTPFIITFLINYISQIFIIIALTEVIYLFEIGSQVSKIQGLVESWAQLNVDVASKEGKCSRRVLFAYVLSE